MIKKIFRPLSMKKNSGTFQTILRKKKCTHKKIKIFDEKMILPKDVVDFFVFIALHPCTPAPLTEGRELHPMHA